MGFLFQLSALFDSMNVEENVAFPLREHERISRSEREERVAEALRTVGLEGVQRKMPEELSGGQKKRVALARAIIRRPSLMLYDEPTTGLDPVRADGIDQLINRLRDEVGVTGLAVTHDLASARHIADHVVMILGGRIAASGTFDDLEGSEDPRVRQFLAGEYDPSFDEQAAPRKDDAARRNSDRGPE
jgi:phospholipid/cholesterol/gamma-HCH transport system ATP-binding protein